MSHHGTRFFILPPFLICSFFLLSAAYKLPPVYFINCGSPSTVQTYGRDFTGDNATLKSVLLSGESSAIEDPASSSMRLDLYRSVRIFRKQSRYEFRIDGAGVYAVRLHFFPFLTFFPLARIRFDVVASQSKLLSNYTMRSRNPRDYPVIEDFLLNITAAKLIIDFVPRGKGFGFVNAIEVFLTPADLLPDSGVRPVSQKVEGKDSIFLLNIPLRVVHRINFGGPKITPDNDTLLRYWIPDDKPGLLLHNDTAKTSKVYEGKLKYQNGRATEFHAPDYVYRTAKELNFVNPYIKYFNASWRFPVQKGIAHLVRVHFCDIVNPTPDDSVRFNLYIYSQFRKEILPYDNNMQAATPFYYDFVVDSDDSGFMNISIGLNEFSGDQTTPFVNGVEIMELLKDLDGGDSTGISSKQRLLIIVGSSIGGVILVLVIVAAFFFSLRKKRRKVVEEFEYPLSHFQAGSSHTRTTVRSSGSPFVDLNLGLRISFGEILYATNKFDEKLKIGEGGFGKVYKGRLRDGIKVAVKRSEPGMDQGLFEFETEVQVLSKIRHHHLVSLIGYCDEYQEMILVYEFMEKGTLREHLYTMENEPRRFITKSELSWEKRLQICIGAATGLQYLHNGLSGAIIHRDIKSANILLDENYVAKVGDFGLSRLGLSDQSHVSTQVKGTFGYLDPECFSTLQLTQKSDVFSFGVVLLEVLCARPAVAPWLQHEQVNLSEWGLLWQSKGELEKIVDPSLVGRINPNSLRVFGQLVMKCLSPLGIDRPKMDDVLWDLEYCLKLQHTATLDNKYLDSSTGVSAMGLLIPMFERLPSDTIGGSEETRGDSRADAGEVFSQLKLGEAR